MGFEKFMAVLALGMVVSSLARAGQTDVNEAAQKYEATAASAPITVSAPTSTSAPVAAANSANGPAAAVVNNVAPVQSNALNVNPVSVENAKAPEKTPQVTPTPLPAPQPQKAAAVPAQRVVPSVTPVPVKVIYVAENQPVQIVDSQGRLLQVIYLKKSTTAK